MPAIPEHLRQHNSILQGDAATLHISLPFARTPITDAYVHAGTCDNALRRWPANQVDPAGLVTIGVLALWDLAQYAG